MHGSFNPFAAGTLIVGNVLVFAMLWGLIGSWVAPWSVLFLHGPSAGVLLWLLGG